ncbi:MAG TPA: AMP-binding protein [Vicinamibacteria bacterium]|nr:AMP-binding protein [Vicinamibacteria bacterium]
MRYPRRVDHGPLLGLFEGSLVRRAAEPGLEIGPPGGPVETLTFGEVAARSERLASGLAGRGLHAGDRLAVQLPNGVPFLDLFLACLKLGAIFVPVNVLYREREVAHIVADAEPLAVVTTRGLAGLVPEGTAVWDVDELALSSRGTPVRPVPKDPPTPGTVDPSSPATDGAPRDDAGDTPAAIVYTSGTTGRAKGAVLTHGNLAANARTLLESWRITAQDRYLAVLPLFHVHGLGNGVCSWLASGCRMRLVERFEHGKAQALFEEFQPTLFFGVPTIYVRLLELPDESARRIGERARLFVSGSAPLPSPVFEAFRAKFGHAVLERYGMTETLMTIGNPYDGERRPGTVGRPLPGVEVRIVGPDGRDRGHGETGELLVRGPAVFSGYWRRPDPTAAAFVDGWFRTGDLGERSADAYFTLRGRASDLILSGGFNVYPREIEEVLLEQRGVREAAVVGVPDERRGERPVAFFAGDADPAALEAACRGQLASFKVPTAFVRVESLPRNAMGKVDKGCLRDGLARKDAPLG